MWCGDRPTGPIYTELTILNAYKIKQGDNRAIIGDNCAPYSLSKAVSRFTPDAININYYKGVVRKKISFKIEPYSTDFFLFLLLFCSGCPSVKDHAVLHTGVPIDHYNI